MILFNDSLWFIFFIIILSFLPLLVKFLSHSGTNSLIVLMCGEESAYLLSLIYELCYRTAVPKVPHCLGTILTLN